MCRCFVARTSSGEGTGTAVTGVAFAGAGTGAKTAGGGLGGAAERGDGPACEVVVAVGFVGTVARVGAVVGSVGLSAVGGAIRNADTKCASS